MFVSRIFVALLLASADCRRSRWRNRPRRPTRQMHEARSLPRAACVRPPARAAGNKEVQAWQTCMKDYVGKVQARADEAVKAANAAVAESNAAVTEYNDTVKAIQAQVDASK